MAEILYQLLEYTWFSNLITLVIFVSIAWKSQLLSSSAISVLSLTVITGISVKYEPFLLSFKSPEDKEWVRFAWYIGKAVFCGITIFCISKTHKVWKKTNSFTTQMILLSVYVEALFHLSRFIERLSWNTDYLLPIYRWGLVSMNIATSATAFTIACFALYNLYNNNKGEKRWNI